MNRLVNLLLHISGVQRACLVLAEHLDESQSNQLLENSWLHDRSKFFGIEWLCLNENVWPRPSPDPLGELFTRAVHQHTHQNLHHPEAWPGGITSMDMVHLAEMCADWWARSIEQGSNIDEWVKVRAPARFGYDVHSPTGQSIIHFINQLKEKW